MSENKNDNPKVLPLFDFASCSSVKLFSRIQTLPNSAFEYHNPPIKNIETAATITAITFNFSIND